MKDHCICRHSTHSSLELGVVLYTWMIYRSVSSVLKTFLLLSGKRLEMSAKVTNDQRKTERVLLLKTTFKKMTAMSVFLEAKYQDLRLLYITVTWFVYSTKKKRYFELASSFYAHVLPVLWRVSSHIPKTYMFVVSKMTGDVS